MKKIAEISKLLLFTFFLAIAASCDLDDDNTQTPIVPNIVQLASASPDLSSLVAALQAADGDLVTVLSGAGPFTVLAPTNEAFATFLSNNDDYTTLADVPTDVLAQVLLNHVIDGSVPSTTLTGAGSGYATTMASGPGDTKLSLYYNTADGVKFNGISTVRIADVQASNGIVHVVDEVIVLPNIVDHALANPGLSSLVNALTDGGNTFFTDLLSTAGEFTVFAPDNAAFTAFTNPNVNDISQVLSNHVVSDVTAISTGLSNGYQKTAATHAGVASHPLNIYINTDDGVRLNGISKVTAADIIATNGVIHVVDVVIDLPTVVTFATADPTFDTLEAALTRSDLTFDYVTTLSTPNDTAPAPFTVFAPTNEAFGNLLTELNVAALADIDEPTLKATLDHHAVTQANVLAASLMDNMTIPTLGGNITANITGGATLTDANGRVSKITATDVQAANGVIHVIDKVVLPPLN